MRMWFQFSVFQFSKSHDLPHFQLMAGNNVSQHAIPTVFHSFQTNAAQSIVGLRGIIHNHINYWSYPIPMNHTTGTKGAFCKNLQDRSKDIAASHLSSDQVGTRVPVPQGDGVRDVVTGVSAARPKPQCSLEKPHQPSGTTKLHFSNVPTSRP